MSSNDSAAEYRPLPTLIKEVKSIAIQALEAKLVEMLNTADDRLFDMAESSYNNAQFDAMRLLRVKREGLLNRFKQELENNFKQTLGKVTDANPADENIETLSFENIALVKDDDLEEDIATDAMVNKARTANQDALEHIRIRLDTIIGDKSVEQQNNPLEPVYICDAFRNATHALDLDIASLLIIYKLFDRSVIDNLESTYLQINQFFVEKGILPELKIGSYIVKKESSNPQSASLQNSNDPAPSLSVGSPTAQDAGSVQNQTASTNGNINEANVAGNNVISVLQQLLSEKRGDASQSNIARDNRADGNLSSGEISGHEHYDSQIPSFDEGAAGNSQIVDTSQLIQALSSIQLNQTHSGSVANLDEITSRGASLRSNLRQSIAVQLPEQEQGALGQFNEDMIDIVSMLFDFILEDENLQPEIKSTIGRLQIPMLKVGLVDKAFFSQRKHPARQLLNELAHAGLAWDKNDPTAKPMLVKIMAIAESVIQDFEDDLSIFETLLEDFLAFKTQHLQRSKIFEKRTKEAEEGKAKTENARSEVNRKLSNICQGKQIPEIVKKVFKSVWSHAMLLERLKKNQPEWERKIKVAKMLVWSVQPIDSAERLEKLTSKVPILVKNLKQGAEVISLSPIEMTQLLEELENCHRNVIEDAKDKINLATESEILRLPAIDIDAPVDNLQANLPQDASADSQASDENRLQDSFPEAEEIIIEDVGFTKAETGQLSSKMNIEPVEITEEVAQRVEQLRAGSWVELKIDDQFQRSKLAARIATSGKYIFVNRSGMKMAEFLTEELCQYLQLGNMRILDDDALFDRALESVIFNLRSMKAEA